MNEPVLLFRLIVIFVITQVITCYDNSVDEDAFINSKMKNMTTKTPSSVMHNNTGICFVFPTEQIFSVI